MSGIQKYVVIGAGISGCTAAGELARSGHEVALVEAGNVIGGAALGYACKATAECSRCGVCVAHTRFHEALTHQHITTIVGASIQSVSHNGQVTVHLTRQNPSINYHACTACDRCVQACPQQCITKIQRGELVQYALDYSRCLLHQGKACAVCAESCPSNAIFAETPATGMSVSGDAVLIATGHAPYDASKKPRLGYGRIDGVLSGVEAEEILSRQTYLRHPTDSVAFIQCVGSRDPSIGRNYCSSVCCAYALRLARIIKHRHPEAPVTVYYIDLQNFDKTFTPFKQSVEAAGVSLVRGLPFSVERTSTGRLKLHIEHGDGEQAVGEHDLVVLSVGMGPASASADIASLFGIARDEFGFFSSTAPNVFVSGTCKEPLSIPDSMTSARAVALEMMPHTMPSPTVKPKLTPSEFERKTIPLQQSVLVIGGGLAGIRTAQEIQRCGYAVTLIERHETLSGEVLANCSDGQCDWTSSQPDAEALAGMTVLTQSGLQELTGKIGNFMARIATPEGEKILNCGAIVVASGQSLPDKPNGSSPIVSILELEQELGTLVKRQGVRSIGLIVDIERDETRARMAMAFRLAQNIQQRKRYQVYLFCRDIRVAAKNLEQCYDEAREAGVTIVKYDGALRLRETGPGVEVSYTDALVRQPFTIYCDRIGISPWGRAIPPDQALADITRLSTDVYGQFQDNNIHLFPEQTNRPGIFVVGACRGQDYAPQILADAKATALAVHALLSQKSLDVELANATVDAEKCVLCLTCVRSCPHQAMYVNRAKGAAESFPEVCRKCGICAGECPAKAISLPMYTDQVLLTEIVEGRSL